MHILARLLQRVVPPVLLACGVALVTAGLLAFAPPADLAPGTAEPTDVAGNPVLTPNQSPPSEPPTPILSPTAEPSFPAYLPTDTPAQTPLAVGPTPSLAPSPSPTPSPTEPRAIASRVVVASLGIDLPIVSDRLRVRGNRNNYPLCDVAQYMTVLAQPGEEGTVYIYAHAQRGMFLPMLRASWRNDGAEMIGAIVEVYTTDRKLHLYEIYRVKRHATNLAVAYNLKPGEHRLVLQTSEGPEGVIPKLQVIARPLGVVRTTREEAMPKPRPRPCPPPR